MSDQTIAATVVAKLSIDDQLTAGLKGLMKTMGEVRAAAEAMSKPGMMAGAEQSVTKFNTSLGTLESKLAALSKVFISPNINTAGITAAIQQVAALQGAMAGLGGGMGGGLSSTSRGGIGSRVIPSDEKYRAATGGSWYSTPGMWAPGLSQPEWMRTERALQNKKASDAKWLASEKEYHDKSLAQQKDAGGKEIQGYADQQRRYSQSAMQARMRQTQIESAGVGYSGRSADGYTGAQPYMGGPLSAAPRVGVGERMWWGSGGRPPVGSAGTPSGPVAKVGRGVGFAVGKVAGGFGSAATYALPYAAFRQITTGVGAALFGTGADEFIEPDRRYLSSGGLAADIPKVHAMGMDVAASTGGQISGKEWQKTYSEIQSTPMLRGMTEEQNKQLATEMNYVAQAAGMTGPQLERQLPVLLGALGEHPDIAHLSDFEKARYVLKLFRHLESKYTLRGQDLMEFLKHSGPSIIASGRPLVRSLVQAAELQSRGVRTSTYGRAVAQSIGDHYKQLAPIMLAGRVAPDSAMGGARWMPNNVYDLTKEQRQFIYKQHATGAFKWLDRKKNILPGALTAWNKLAFSAKLFPGPEGPNTLSAQEYMGGLDKAGLLEDTFAQAHDVAEDRLGQQQIYGMLPKGMQGRMQTAVGREEVRRKTNEATANANIAMLQPGMPGYDEYMKHATGSPTTAHKAMTEGMSNALFGIYSRIGFSKQQHSFGAAASRFGGRMERGDALFSKGGMDDSLRTLGFFGALSGGAAMGALYGLPLGLPGVIGGGLLGAGLGTAGTLAVGQSFTDLFGDINESTHPNYGQRAAAKAAITQREKERVVNTEIEKYGLSTREVKAGKSDTSNLFRSKDYLKLPPAQQGIIQQLLGIAPYDDNLPYVVAGVGPMGLGAIGTGLAIGGVNAVEGAAGWLYKKARQGPSSPYPYAGASDVDEFGQPLPGKQETGPEAKAFEKVEGGGEGAAVGPLSDAAAALSGAAAALGSAAAHLSSINLNISGVGQSPQGQAPPLPVHRI